jgi:hypothetical protein
MRITRLAFVVALAAFVVAFPAAAGTLEGRWVLVEETYGAGGLDLSRHKPEQTIEFVRERGALVAKARMGEDARIQTWPPATGDAQLSYSPQEGQVRVRYRTPENDDRFCLEIVEEYRASADGNELSGTMKVTFLREGEERGSFVLHRRFERRP